MTDARSKLYRTIALHALMISLAALFLLPFVWLVVTSFKNDSHIRANPTEWVPRAEYVQRPSGAWREVLRAEDMASEGKPGKLRVQISDWSGHLNKSVVVDRSELHTRTLPIVRHYLRGFVAFSFALYLWNTLFICLISVLASTFTSALVAYAFSVLRWPGRDVVFYVMLATLMLPAQVTMVPVFLIYRQLGLVNTFGPLVIGSFFGKAFYIFLLRQFFLTIPRDLVDAARMDGCSEWRIFSRLILPMSVLALSVVALFAFVAQWNDFLTPLIYLSGEAKYTLSLGLGIFERQYSTYYGELTAMSALITLPILVLFYFAQKTIIQNVRTADWRW